jgi:DNA-binding NtrC family response regulator
MTSAAPRSRILVVDNEPLICWSIGERLRRDGYEVIEAPPGVSVLEAIGCGVDLIILGCDADTPEACRSIARLKCLAPHVPLILLTTSYGADTAAKAMQLGASAIARKPFGVDHIATMIRTALTPGAGANSYAPA